VLLEPYPPVRNLRLIVYKKIYINNYRLHFFFVTRRYVKGRWTVFIYRSYVCKGIDHWTKTGLLMHEVDPRHRIACHTV